MASFHPHYLTFTLQTSTHSSKSATNTYIQPYLHKVFVWTKHKILILCILFKQSISSGVIDPSLKRAAIVPVLKSGDRTAPSNYRPISLTSVIIKVLERIIRKQIVAFLISKGYLNPTQHGFREGRSCLSALLNVFDDIMHLMSGGNTVDMVYLDFAKAFDKVDHGVLLHKIKTLGITGKLGV